MMGVMSDERSQNVIDGAWLAKMSQGLVVETVTQQSQSKPFGNILAPAFWLLASDVRTKLIP